MAFRNFYIATINVSIKRYISFQHSINIGAAEAIKLGGKENSEII